jgi:hypothetical protein
VIGASRTGDDAFGLDGAGFARQTGRMVSMNKGRESAGPTVELRRAGTDGELLGRFAEFAVVATGAGAQRRVTVILRCGRLEGSASRWSQGTATGNLCLVSIRTVEGGQHVRWHLGAPQVVQIAAASEEGEVAEVVLAVETVGPAP